MNLELVDRRLVRPEPAGDWFEQNRDLIARLAGHVGHPEMEVDLVLIDDATMARLNQEWRRKEGPTDVLSFSDLIPDPVPRFPGGEFHLAEGLSLTGPSLPDDGERRTLGEIFLAPDFVDRRCRENSWSVTAEFPMLIVHGMLHVVGWDHRDDEELKAMQDIEETVLRAEQLTHPLRGNASGELSS